MMSSSLEDSGLLVDTPFLLNQRVSKLNSKLKHDRINYLIKKQQNSETFSCEKKNSESLNLTQTATTINACSKKCAKGHQLNKSTINNVINSEIDQNISHPCVLKNHSINPSVLGYRQSPISPNYYVDCSNYDPMDQDIDEHTMSHLSQLSNVHDMIYNKDSLLNEISISRHCNTNEVVESHHFFQDRSSVDLPIPLKFQNDLNLQNLLHNITHPIKKKNRVPICFNENAYDSNHIKTFLCSCSIQKKICIDSTVPKFQTKKIRQHSIVRSPSISSYKKEKAPSFFEHHQKNATHRLQRTSFSSLCHLLNKSHVLNHCVNKKTNQPTLTDKNNTFFTNHILSKTYSFDCSKSTQFDYLSTNDVSSESTFQTAYFPYSNTSSNALTQSHKDTSFNPPLPSNDRSYKKTTVPLLPSPNVVSKLSVSPSHQHKCIQHALRHHDAPLDAFNRHGLHDMDKTQRVSQWIHHSETYKKKKSNSVTPCASYSTLKPTQMIPYSLKACQYNGQEKIYLKQFKKNKSRGVTLFDITGSHNKKLKVCHTVSHVAAPNKKLNKKHYIILQLHQSLDTGLLNNLKYFKKSHRLISTIYYIHIKHNKCILLQKKK